MAWASTSEPIAADRPVASTKRQAASIFGAIEPAAKVSVRSFIGVVVRIAFAVGVPHSR
jgi:hypothetical protein